MTMDSKHFSSHKPADSKHFFPHKPASYNKISFSLFWDLQWDLTLIMIKTDNMKTTFKSFIKP